MNNEYHKKICEYIELFFEEIPYSETTFQAKERITACLEQEYEKLKNEDRATAFSKLADRYHSLDVMAERAGYASGEADRWKSCSGIIDFDTFKKLFKKEKRNCIIALLLGIAAAVHLVNCIINFHVAYIIQAVLTVSAEAVFLYRYKKAKKDPDDEFFTVDCYERFKQLYDKYTKKTFNSIFIGFLLFYGFVTALVDLSINSKSYELLEFVNSYLFYMEIAVFLILKNILLNQWIVKKTKLERANTYQKYVKREVFAASIYFSAAFAVFYAVKKYFPLISVRQKGFYMAYMPCYFSLPYAGELPIKTMCLTRGKSSSALR